MTRTADVGPRLVDGHLVELAEEEKQALAGARNAEQAPRAAPLPYREARALAYRDELGKEQGDFIRTLGDVLITQMEAIRRSANVPSTAEYADMLAMIAAIKARYPLPSLA